MPQISPVTKEYVAGLADQEVFDIYLLAVENELTLMAIHGSAIIQATIQLLSDEIHHRVTK